ncbi:hypothetical protein ABZ896_13500 [Streptomyces sp. NPDC047072]|uniref:hypothetical protein n=1 Tax=Streptomyces sp. NPDC047072 TaxID=3154809 RepID=UPI0033CBE777
MRGIRRVLPPLLLVLSVLLAGCGIRPSGVAGAGEPLTGLAPGVTLYFVGGDGRLEPQLRRTGRLGTVSEAVSLLLSGPGDAGLRTEIGPAATRQVVVTTASATIRLMVPLTVDKVTARGIDQIVCTALGVHVQGGGARQTRVQVQFVQPTPESATKRACPLFT